MLFIIDMDGSSCKVGTFVVDDVGIVLGISDQCDEPTIWGTNGVRYVIVTIWFVDGDHIKGLSKIRNLVFVTTRIVLS